MKTSFSDMNKTISINILNFVSVTIITISLVTVMNNNFCNFVNLLYKNAEKLEIEAIKTRFSTIVINLTFFFLTGNFSF